MEEGKGEGNQCVNLLSHLNYKLFDILDYRSQVYFC